MSDKEKILAALRKSSPPAAAAPTLDASHWVRYDDRIAQFEQMVQAVGGSVVDAGDAGLIETLEQLPIYRDSETIYSDLENIAGGVDLAAVDDPHDLAHVDLCCASGQWGVAENGAVWTTGPAEPRHRVILFLAQHLILTLPRANVLNNMHEAYDRIELPEPGFGVFISGPSKTADIEQSLVIGAHGARSLHVILTA